MNWPKLARITPHKRRLNKKSYGTRRLSITHKLSTECGSEFNVYQT